MSFRLPRPTRTMSLRTASLPRTRWQRSSCMFLCFKDIFSLISVAQRHVRWRSPRPHCRNQRSGPLFHYTAVPNCTDHCLQLDYIDKVKAKRHGMPYSPCHYSWHHSILCIFYSTRSCRRGDCFRILNQQSSDELVFLCRNAIRDPKVVWNPDY